MTLSSYLRGVLRAARDGLPFESRELEREHHDALKAYFALPMDSAMRGPAKARCDALNARSKADPFLRFKDQIWREIAKAELAESDARLAALPDGGAAE